MADFQHHFRENWNTYSMIDLYFGVQVLKWRTWSIQISKWEIKFLYRLSYCGSLSPSSFLNRFHMIPILLPSELWKNIGKSSKISYFTSFSIYFTIYLPKRKSKRKEIFILYFYKFIESTPYYYFMFIYVYRYT